jgi:hypothetical protein
MIFATSGSVSGESGFKRSIRTIADKPSRNDDVNHTARKIDSQKKREVGGVDTHSKTVEPGLVDGTERMETSDEKGRVSALPHARLGVNNFALDGLRFARGNGRRLGSFTRVGLVVLEGESANGSTVNDGFGHIVPSHILPTLQNAGHDRQAEKHPARERFGRALHFVAARQELSIGNQLRLGQQDTGTTRGTGPVQYAAGKHHDHFDIALATNRARLPDLNETASHSSCQTSPQSPEPPEIAVPDAAPQPNSQEPSRRARIRGMGYEAPLLFSFFLGIVATMVIPAALNGIAAMHAHYYWRQMRLTDVQRVNDPLALPRMYRDDRLFSYLDLAVNRSSKRPFDDVQLAAADPGIQADGAAGSDSAASGTELEEHNSLASLDGAAQPSLYFDPASGQQVIGSFKTLSFPGDHELCTDTAQSMISDAKGDQNSLHTLADTREIKVMRICAGNGAVIITCRNNQVTISPRRSRPDDGCRAHDVSKQASKAL